MSLFGHINSQLEKLTAMSMVISGYIDGYLTGLMCLNRVLNRDGARAACLAFRVMGIVTTSILIGILTRFKVKELSMMNKSSDYRRVDVITKALDHFYLWVWYFYFFSTAVVEIISVWKNEWPAAYISPQCSSFYNTGYYVMSFLGAMSILVLLIAFSIGFIVYFMKQDASKLE